MKALARVLTLGALLVLPLRSALGQESGCARIRGIIGMVHARSIAALEAARVGAGDDYRARTVYTTRRFEISPGVASAEALLDMIPQNDEQQTTWVTFGDSLCDQESLKEMADLSRFGDRLQRDVSRAVLMVPAQMSRYVSYAKLATQDPHTRYAVEMKVVCRRNRSALQASVMTLAPDFRDWFEEHVFDVRRCLPKALPEAD